MKTILVTTDFTHHSRKSLDTVLELFGKKSCRILLLNTFTVDNRDARDIIRLNDELKQQSREKLEEEKKLALQKNSGGDVIIETSSRMGSLGNVIGQILAAEEIELVAMGKNGGDHVQTVTQILKKFHCPLLITHADDQ